MSHSPKSSGKVLFLAIAAIVFLGTMLFVTGGKFDVVTITAIPILMGAEGIVFILLYATTYHSEAETASRDH